MSRRLLIGLALAGLASLAATACGGKTEAGSGGTGNGGSTRWDEAVCWASRNNPAMHGCSLAVGELWVPAQSPCWLDDALALYTEISPEPVRHLCGDGSEDNSGWEQVRCFDAGEGVIRCAALVDGWWVGILPGCSLTILDSPDWTEIAPDPTQAHCDTSGSVAGLDEVRCWVSDSDSRLCHGRIGGFWTYLPIKPTCALDFDQDPDFVRVDPGAVVCDGSAGSGV